MGEQFGTVYDVSAWSSCGSPGPSAMAGLLNLVPQYLPRYGMAPDWARAHRPLVSCSSAGSPCSSPGCSSRRGRPGGRYATGVLVLMTSDSIGLAHRPVPHRTGPRYRRLSLVVPRRSPSSSCYTLGATWSRRPAGIKIASFFIGAILVVSIVSRIVRSRELRFEGFNIADPVTRLLWDTLRHLELSILVPHRPGRRSLTEKEQTIRKEHRLTTEMIVFVEVELEDASEFHQKPTCGSSRRRASTSSRSRTRRPSRTRWRRSPWR